MGTGWVVEVVFVEKGNVRRWGMDVGVLMGVGEDGRVRVVKKRVEKDEIWEGNDRRRDGLIVIVGLGTRTGMD